MLSHHLVYMVNLYNKFFTASGNKDRNHTQAFLVPRQWHLKARTLAVPLMGIRRWSETEKDKERVLPYEVSAS